MTVYVCGVYTAGRAGEDSSDYGDDFDDLEESVPSEVEDDLSFGGEVSAYIHIHMHCLYIYDG